MNSIFRLVAKSVLVSYLIVAGSVCAAEKEDEARAAALANVRPSAAARDMAAVREKLAAAGKLKGAAEFDAELLRLKELCDYLEKFWQAVDDGVDVKQLLPELDAERPLPPVEISPLTPALRNRLAEKNWSFRVKGEKGWTRKPLDMRVEQNSEGRLAAKIPAAEGDSLQLIAKKPLTGDSVVRLILSDVKKGQTLGLFAADAQDPALSWNFPPEPSSWNSVGKEVSSIAPSAASRAR